MSIEVKKLLYVRAKNLTCASCEHCNNVDKKGKFLCVHHRDNDDKSIATNFDYIHSAKGLGCEFHSMIPSDEEVEKVIK